MFLNPTYVADDARYNSMTYNRCGKSGIKLPAFSLGLWQNFGNRDNLEICRDILRFAFDQGITNFDLANNYGPPYGAAEETFGKIFREDFKPYREELFISTKAGYDMWPGPYGDWGSKKYLVSSLDQSLKRMGVEYVDLFYHHRPDPETPLEETMSALDLIVRQGKALYIGLSNYTAEQTKEASRILKDLGTPCLIHQPVYSMFNRWVEDGLLDVLEEEGIGCIPFSPLSQGMLTNKYIKGIPEGSRASKDQNYLDSSQITEEKIKTIQALNEIALQRGQSLAQMALAWIMKDPRITTILMGVSRVEQLQDNINTLKNVTFTSEELSNIEKILK